MKKYIGVTGLIIIILGSFLIFKNYKEDLKMKCTNSSNLSYVLFCMETGKLYNQEQYDAYYNIAAKNPSLSIIEDDIFYRGFALAYNNCGFDSKPYSCNRRNKEVMDEFILKCTQNAKKLGFCTDYYFRNNNPNKNNIMYFIKVVKNQIKEDSISKDFSKIWSCQEPYKSFYDLIQKNLIHLVPLEVQQMCNKKD